ncbi:hypothetical protein ACOMHN_056738 [Nucella lapillus]
MIPQKNWNSFLQVDANKTELFSYIAQCVINIETEKLIVTTRVPVSCQNMRSTRATCPPCNHEEADTRMMVHLVHAAQHNKKVMVRTVYTDVVVVLAVAVVACRLALEVWIAVGAGKDVRFIAVHSIVRAVGVGKSRLAVTQFLHSVPLARGRLGM